MIIKNIDINSFKDKNNYFHKLWEEKENNNIPNYLNKIISIDYKDFENIVRSGSKEEQGQIVDSLLNGDVYLLKNAFDKKFLNNLKKETLNVFNNSESSFHKIIEGCPNFHRNITEEKAGKYAFKQIKHTHYFFPFNNDFFDLYKETYKRWRLLKYISGYYEDCWENNSPKDGIVDRIQIVKYPPNSGELELHQDPYLYQKFFISIYMSKRDVDYRDGGMYLIDKDKNKVELEKDISYGDMAFGFATIMHGVEKSFAIENQIDELSGRWFMGLYSIASDYIENRHTGRPAKAG